VQACPYGFCWVCKRPTRRSAKKRDEIAPLQEALRQPENQFGEDYHISICRCVTQYATAARTTAGRPRLEVAIGLDKGQGRDDGVVWSLTMHRGVRFTMLRLQHAPA
jgi:hypothetical protein